MEQLQSAPNSGSSKIVRMMPSRRSQTSRAPRHLYGTPAAGGGTPASSSPASRSRRQAAGWTGLGARDSGSPLCPPCANHPTSARRPASVIRTRVTTIARRLTCAGSRSAMTSPSRIKRRSVSIGKPWANRIDSLYPCVDLASRLRASRWSITSDIKYLA